MTNQLKVHHIASQDQPADVFTKSLSVSKFYKCRRKLKVLPPLKLRGAVKDSC